MLGLGRIELSSGASAASVILGSEQQMAAVVAVSACWLELRKPVSQD